MGPLHGAGLRTCHYDDALDRGLPFGFVEIIVENFIGRGGRPRAVLERIRMDAEIALHGVSLSLGGFDPLPMDHLRALRELADQLEVTLVSDHACFGSVGGHFGHDLWPLPFTEEAARHLADRISRVQDVLGRPFLIENVSSYVEYADSTLTEWEFLSAVSERADCHLLLDVNNVYVSSKNHGFDPRAFVRALPARRVAQLHLAGHLDCGTHLLDNHGCAVQEPVWALYADVVRQLGSVPTIIEWDEDPPSLARLGLEVDRVRATEAECQGSAA